MNWAFFARTLGSLMIAFLAATALTPLADLLDRSATIPPELEPSDAIIVPGSGDASPAGILTNTSAVRTLHAITLYQKGLAPLIVFSGGAHEVTARTRLAHDRGVPAEAILTEARAHTTREEALRIADLLRPRGTRTILLVAHSFELVRAAPLFQRAGFEVRRAPTDDLVQPPESPEQRLVLMRSILEEFAARLYYRLARYL
jgi:uncharacterized SAM-binding protein YcdF (DUF218 family)